MYLMCILSGLIPLIGRQFVHETMCLIADLKVIYARPIKIILRSNIQIIFISSDLLRS